MILILLKTFFEYREIFQINSIFSLNSHFLAIFNPFASQAPCVQASQPQQNQPDLVNFFDAPAPGNPSQTVANNPFASFTAPTQPQSQTSMGTPSSNPFGAFQPTNNFGQMPASGPFSTPAPQYGAVSQPTFNPFGNATGAVSNAPSNFGGYPQAPFCKFVNKTFYFFFSEWQRNLQPTTIF